MRLLPLVVLSLAAFVCQATDDDDTAETTKFLFTMFELTIVDDIDEMGPNMPKRQLKKFNHEVFSVLKLTVPRGTQPTEAQLQKAARDLAKSARDASNAFRSRSNITSEILKIVTNTAELTKEQGPVSEEQPSPSAFANAVRKIEGKDSNSSYVIAAFARCFLDKVKHMPIHGHIELSEEKIGGAFVECDRKFGLEELDWTNVLLLEALETFSSDRNSEVIVKGMSLLVQAIRDESSYSSADAFIENVKKSKRLTALAVMSKEIKRCLPTEYDEGSRMLDETLNNLTHVVREAFAGGEGPTQEKLQKAAADFSAESEKYNQSTLAALKQNALAMERNFSECIVPEAVIKKLEKMKLVLNGVEADEAKLLEELKKLNAFAHATVVVLYEHLHTLRNRVGMNSEANEFITKVLTWLEEWSELDMTTEAGKTAFARLIEDLRNSVINLSRDGKKIFVDHFPFRTPALLGVLF